jgi:hypothetical protein
MTSTSPSRTPESDGDTVWARRRATGNGHGGQPGHLHHEENIGETPAHVIFVELKEPGAPTDSVLDELGPC